MIAELEQTIKILSNLSSNDIALYLLNNKIIGIPKKAARCPIANYFRKILNQSDVVVGITSFYVNGMRYDLSKNILDFIELFDNGAYPELIDISDEDNYSQD